MLSSSTNAILKSLSLQELKRFGDFIKSPYFNPSLSHHIIFDIVLRSFPEFNSDSLSNENLAKKIFPNEVNKEKRVNNLCSEFGNLLRKFLGYEDLNERTFDLDVNIAQGLAKKQLFELSNKFINKNLEQKNTGFITDDLKYSFRDRMNLQKVTNIGQIGETIEDLNDINMKIQENKIVMILRDTYAAGNMEFLTDSFFGKEIKKSLNTAFLDSIDSNKFLDHLKASNNKYYSYLKIAYLLFYYSANDISPEQYFELKNEILKTIYKIDKWEAYTILVRANEIILLKLIPVDAVYNREVFEFSKIFCDLKIFPDHAQHPLQIGVFRDMFNPALVLKEYEWAEYFANEYIPYLNEEYRETELNYCNGVLNFKKGKYEDSLYMLSKVKADYILIKVNIRFYFLMNYIELKAFESARSALHAFRQFYKDNEEIPKVYYIRIYDALKYLNEINKCLEEGTKFDQYLYNEANDGRKYFHSIYIKEKIEKLI